MTMKAGASLQAMINRRNELFCAMLEEECKERGFNHTYHDQLSREYYKLNAEIAAIQERAAA